jgi:hypothetical protein
MQKPLFILFFNLLRSYEKYFVASLNFYEVKLKSNLKET